jgi:serine/threonine protein kinase
MDNLREIVSSRLTSEQWSRLKSLFESALEMSESSRTKLLANICDCEPDIGTELRILLENYNSFSSSFDHLLLSKSRVLEYFEAGLRAFQPGDKIGERFLIERFLGEGGMGEVYAAHDLELEATVALKTLRPAISSDVRMIESFKQEVQLARRVTHPNVCRIFDIFWHRAINGTPVAVLSMEHLSGQTLLHYIRSKGPLEVKAAWPIACQIAEGLAAAHAAGIVHGDFKSSNVMLVRHAGELRAVITDFGLAHEQHSSLEKRIERFGDRAGTPAYMAPEQLTGGPLSPAVDIYALGVVLFEMVTGNCPYEENGVFHVGQRAESDIPSPRAFVPALSRNWEQTILRCLGRNPSSRPGNALQVVDLLQNKKPNISRRVFLAASAVFVVTVPASSYLFKSRPKPWNPRALASFKRAEEFSKRRNEEGLLNAIEEYHQALDYEPNRLEIWIGLADSYSAAANFQFVDPRQALPKAREAAIRAIQIDASSGRAQGVLAYCMSIDLSQWLQAEPYFQRAIQLAPRDARVRLWYGAHLGKFGRVDEALAQLKVGLDEEPASLALNQQLATEYFLSIRTAELMAQARELIRLQPFEAAAHLMLARAFEQTGDYANALRSCEKGDEYHHSMGALCVRGSIMAVQGHFEISLKIARDVEKYWTDKPFESLLLAALYARTGHSEKAIAVLLVGCDRNDSSVLYAPQHPHLISVHSQPQYKTFLARIGLSA